MSQDFVLYERVKSLENELDQMRGLVHNLKHEQQDMVQQIRKLKEKMSDGSGK